jgi:hypothetical protein
MPDITEQIKTAIINEPPLGFEPASVIAAARRVRRRRRAGYTAATAGLAAAVTAGTVLALPGGGAGRTPAESTPPGQPARLSLTALSRIAGTRPATVPGLRADAARVDGKWVTAAQVFALFEKDTGIKVADTTVSLLQPPGDLDLAAGLAVPGHPYLNIQVTSANTLSTTMPACAELSDLASGSGDGYYGPCTTQRLADGSILVVRSGETRKGHFTMAQATLIRPDGSGVFAEDTNQAQQTIRSIVKAKKAIARGGKPALPPVVSASPPVSASTLASFVRDVAAQA